jgi:hypothetical protein
MRFSLLGRPYRFGIRWCESRPRRRVSGPRLEVHRKEPVTSCERASAEVRIDGAASHAQSTCRISSGVPMADAATHEVDARNRGDSRDPPNIWCKSLRRGSTRQASRTSIASKQTSTRSPSRRRAFGADVAANVLHLVLDFDRAIALLRTVLKPQGRLVVPTLLTTRPHSLGPSRGCSPSPASEPPAVHRGIIPRNCRTSAPSRDEIGGAIPG